MSLLPYYDIPCLALADGEAVTLSFLKWIGNTVQSIGTTLIGPGLDSNSPMTSSEHCLIIDGGYDNTSNTYIFAGVVSSSGLGGGHSYVNFFAGTGSYSSNYLRMNSLNDFTITIQRTGASYAINAFVNGTLALSNTTTNANHFNFTKLYLNYLRGSSNSLSYHDNRGIAQLAIYSGVKYTANYTPTYALLKKTV